MADSNDDIPVLTDAIERAAPATPASNIDALQDELCAASLAHAEALLRDACREAEHVLFERTLNALRAELPGIVRGILNEHLEK